MQRRRTRPYAASVQTAAAGEDVKRALGLFEHPFTFSSCCVLTGSRGTAAKIIPLKALRLTARLSLTYEAGRERSTLTDNSSLMWLQQRAREYMKIH